MMKIAPTSTIDSRMMPGNARQLTSRRTASSTIVTYNAVTAAASDTAKYPL